MDNANVTGLDIGLVTSLSRRLSDVLETKGLRTHGETDASTDFTTLGVVVDGIGGPVAPTPKRVWRALNAPAALEKRSKSSGRAVEIVVGHLTSLFMLRRLLFAIFSAA